jgi:prepilin-type N-terminal cleavage/methylation domain-containing protein
VTLTRCWSSPGGRRGFTLIELLVVLIIVAIGVGFVAPALLPPRRDPESALAALIRRTRDIAAAREETVYLGVAPGGRWRLDAGAAADRPLATGELPGYAGPAATLVVSPLGTCGFDTRSGEAARTIPIDPLTCEFVAP